MITSYQVPTSSASPVGSILKKGRILIACNDESISRGLEADFKKANLPFKQAKDFNAACKLLKSGKFQVIYTTPELTGASWRKLMEFAHSTNLIPCFVIVASSFDLSDWAECLNSGAFEVLDAVNEMTRATEVAREALLANFARARQELKKADGSQIYEIPPFNSGCPELAT